MARPLAPEQRGPRTRHGRRRSGAALAAGWLGLLGAWLLGPGTARADDFYVDAAAGPGGDGSRGAPFGELQEGLDAAQAGDVVHVLPGTYGVTSTIRDGTAAAPITVVGEPAGDAVIQGDGTALEAHHEYHTFQGLVFDGGYGAGDAIDADGANFLELLDVEVRRSGRDCIDLHTVEGVLIANSVIHHCVNEDMGAPADAHGITGDSVFDLEVRDTEIYLFSGDALQMSPPREAWDQLVLRRCTLWTGALDEDAGSIAAGTIIGENALDTKVGTDLNGSGSPPRVEIEDVVAYGFRDFISNQAAFLVKEDVDVLIDRVTVYQSELAFRLRGPAQVAIHNAVVHDVDSVVRHEDALTGAALLATTIGAGVSGDPFVDGGGGDAVDFTIENLLILGGAVPDLASGGAANLAVDASVFLDADAHDYRLVEGSDPVDAGVDLEAVTQDRDGTFRPVGDAHDIGAYEWDVDDPPPPATTGDESSSGGEEAGASGDETAGADGTTAGAGSSEGSGGSVTGTGFDMGGGMVDGCGCRSRADAPAGWLLALVLAGLGRRRQRRSRPGSLRADRARSAR